MAPKMVGMPLTAATPMAAAGREPLERRWRRHLERRADYGYLFWSLLILSIYFQQNPEEL